MTSFFFSFSVSHAEGLGMAVSHAPSHYVTIEGNLLATILLLLIGRPPKSISISIRLQEHIITAG